MSRIVKTVAVFAGTGAMALAGAGMAVADSGAQGAATNSPGVLSGNVIQVPVHIPVNLCGNTVNVIGVLNPAFGNTCINGDLDKGHHKGGHDNSYNEGAHEEKGYGSQH